MRKVSYLYVLKDLSWFIPEKSYLILEASIDDKR